MKARLVCRLRAGAAQTFEIGQAEAVMGREVRQRLDAAAIPYTLSRSGRRALFCRDPDGNALELIEAAA